MRRRALAVVAALAAASVAATPSCRAPAPYECDTVIIQPPKVVHDATGKALVGTATRSTCQGGDIISHHVQLSMWWRPTTAAEWTLDSQTGLDTCASKPRPGHPTGCALGNTCRVGWWQVRATVTGANSEGDFVFNLPERPETHV